MRYEKSFRKIVILETLFIGIAAIIGGMDIFVNYEGNSFLIINGIINIIATFLIAKRKRTGAYLVCFSSIILIILNCIDFISSSPNSRDIIFLIFGIVQIIFVYTYLIFLKQSEFKFEINNYNNIGKDKDTLVVYFSRLGYTRKVAYEKADKIGASIYEVTTPERIDGFLGFAWLGRFAMHKWAMPIDDIRIDVSKYKKIIIVTPIHVFTVSAPIKGFCEIYKDKIKNVDYVVVQFRKDMISRKAFDEMDKVLNTKANSREVVVCKFGNVVNRIKI